MKTLSQVLDGSLKLTRGGESYDTANIPQRGLTLTAGPMSILALPPLEQEPPHQRAQRATNAASWLASPELRAVRTSLQYANRFNESKGVDEYVPAFVSVSVRLESLSETAHERVLTLMHPASVEEITYHLNRLLLHRRKASIGEATLPAFIEDVAGDLRRLGVTTLGMALTASALRLHPLDQWYPQWPEIESVACAVENGLKAMLRPMEQPTALPNPDISRDRRDIPKAKWLQQDWQDWVDEAARMAAMWRENGEIERAKDWVEVVRGRIMEFDSEARGFKIIESEVAKWVL